MRQYRFTGVVEAEDAHDAVHRMFKLIQESEEVGWFEVRPTLREMAHNLFRGEPDCSRCGAPAGSHDLSGDQ